MKKNRWGEFQELILMTVVILKEEAYGNEIERYLEILLAQSKTPVHLADLEIIKAGPGQKLNPKVRFNHFVMFKNDFITIFSRTLRASEMNPVSSLRDE